MYYSKKEFLIALACFFFFILAGLFGYHFHLWSMIAISVVSLPLCLVALAIHGKELCEEYIFARDVERAIDKNEKKND